MCLFHISTIDAATTIFIFVRHHSLIGCCFSESVHEEGNGSDKNQSKDRHTKHIKSPFRGRYNIFESSHVIDFYICCKSIPDEIESVRNGEHLQWYNLDFHNFLLLLAWRV